MAITVNWATDQVINVPKADMTLVQLTPVEIRRLDTDAFFTSLKNLEASEEGIPWPDTQKNNTATTLGGITYARVLEILDPYSITFEDGLYVVQLVGSNNNIIEKTNPNQVSVQGNNAAGLIQVPEIQYATFQNGVTLDQANGTPGQAYPAGTPLQPVNNLDDALFIANLRGFDTIFIKGTYTFASTDVVNDFIFEGDSPVKNTVVLTGAASITNCIFRNVTMTGQLDGGNSASNCIVSNVNYIDGSLRQCLIVGTVTLSGTQANILECGSGVAGGGPGLTPTIDFDGNATNLIIRDWEGGLEIINKTNPAGDVSIDLSSGRVVVGASNTAGTIYTRGVGEVQGTSGGTTVVNTMVFGGDVIEMHKRLGLNRNDPITDTDAGIQSQSGDIDIVRTGDGISTSTLTRQ